MRSNSSVLFGPKSFRRGLAVSGDSFYISDDEILIGPPKNVPAFFISRLLKKIQFLGTVPAIKWNKYATVQGCIGFE